MVKIHSPTSLLPKNSLGNHRIEGWVGMDVSEKKNIYGLLPGIEP
jgi:hypothetical protein